MGRPPPERACKATACCAWARKGRDTCASHKPEPRWVVVVEEHDQAGPFVASVVGPFETEDEADEHCLAIVKARGLGCAPSTHELEKIDG